MFRQYGVLLVLCLSPWWWLITAVVAIANVLCQPWVFVQPPFEVDQEARIRFQIDVVAGLSAQVVEGVA
jgi:hypothetical protein